MKNAVAIALCVALAIPLAAQNQQTQNHPSNYLVFNLGTFGGTGSQGNGIDDLGLVTGVGNETGDQVLHAAAWFYGLGFDLGALGGPNTNSGVLFVVKSNRGEIVGISQTATPDPLGERWSCSAFLPYIGNTCVGFDWKNGVMSPLPTLGGNNGFAAGVNNSGQIVGWTENTVHDPTCVGHQILQFEPVVWGPGKNQIKQLPVLSGDVDGSAVALNNEGQIVGISGICYKAVGASTAKHMVLWQNGRATEIPNLGGVAWNTPVAINNHGEVVGFSDLPGDGPDSPNFHAFLWTKEHGTVDLKTLPGDTLSEALGINDQGQIVGISFGGNNGARAFIYENGKMTDLNTLLAPGTPYTLAYAGDINDLGEITGGLIDPNHTTCGPASGGCAFLALSSPFSRGSQASSAAPQVVDRSPEIIRKQLQSLPGFGRVAALATLQ